MLLMCPRSRWCSSCHQQPAQQRCQLLQPAPNMTTSGSSTQRQAQERMECGLGTNGPKQQSTPSRCCGTTPAATQPLAKQQIAAAPGADTSAGTPCSRCWWGSCTGAWGVSAGGSLLPQQQYSSSMEQLRGATGPYWQAAGGSGRSGNV
jgi:hypothetical protein